MSLLLSYNARNLRARWRATLLAAAGIAIVVAVFIVLLSTEAGFRIALRATGRPDNAIVVQRGSMSELTSWVPMAHRNLLVVDAHVARDAAGRPLVSDELVILTSMPRRGDGAPTNVSLRGVTPLIFGVRSGIHITRGANFRTGLYELIAGERIARRVEGLDLGATVRMQRHDWKVVGLFTAGGGAFESEVWGDLNVIGPAFRRVSGASSLVVRLADPSRLAEFDEFVRANPEMRLQAALEQEYYEDQAGRLSLSLIVLAGFVSLFMGVGAVFGAMNTMYATIAARTREIGTLRAIGFSRRSIVIAFVVESVILAGAGGLLGCAIALPVHGLATATGQTPSFSEVAFAFRLTPRILALGLAFAVSMGFLGGLLPALRAALLPISSALREA